MKNTFLLYGSTASTLKNTWNYPKKLVSSIWFVFKIWFAPNFSNIFQKHKKTWNKKIMFPIDKKTRFHQPEWRIDWKLCSSWRKNWFHWEQLTAVWENGRKYFPWGTKSVFISENMLFLFLRLASFSFSDGFH